MYFSQHYRSRPSACLSTVLALTAMLTPGFTAYAGVFSVAPVRLYMTPRDRAIAVTLTNEGDTPLVLQADINDWRQSPDGTEELVPTEDLILFPPVIKLAPRSRQVVRLALLRAADANQQLTYRMIMREVPQAQPSASIEVPISLALSLPVFITPPLAKSQLRCALSGTAAGTQITLRCSNEGRAYAQVRGASLTRDGKLLASFEGASYVLAGSSKPIALAGSDRVTSGEATLVITLDDGQSVTQSLTLP